MSIERRTTTSYKTATGGSRRMRKFRRSVRRRTIIISRRSRTSALPLMTNSIRRKSWASPWWGRSWTRIPTTILTTTVRRDLWRSRTFRKLKPITTCLRVKTLTDISIRRRGTATISNNYPFCPITMVLPKTSPGQILRDQVSKALWCQRML